MGGGGGTSREYFFFFIRNFFAKYSVQNCLMSFFIKGRGKFQKWVQIS